ncbi:MULTISPECIES: helicase-exonuclease AddAB subunit AddB [Staphylococcus]|uniref:helicase-exonuclease AddAB subunit AddB n=1 Tax=Staphylococcus sp. HMSC34C02 TaxID=1608858 RepID=UPI0008A90CB5|nr:helicase-exonuclease AddAB subunit AddB [Staphylococcus sp. HMSC34C02]OHR83553.1 helicase-exonuclease AddAB subunit AddB [Staphylococcus sp. HMSC34C02]
MELNAYIGRAGTGKSHYMINNIKQQMKDDPLGDPIILIAPTQSTFQLEQAFVSDKALNGSLRTEVLHFERLSYRVFQEVGGLTEERLTQAATEMMIYDLVQQHQSELKLYRSQVNYYGFSEKLSEQIQDFKKYAVTPEHLKSFLQDNDISTRTKHKLEDISLIYQSFEERINGAFITSEDSLNHFIDILNQSEWIKRSEIYIDGFHNFSTLEYQIIKALVQNAKKVTVLLTTDGNEDPFSLFRKPSEVLTHLKEIANDLNIDLQQQLFKQQHRFNNKDLMQLEQQFDALQINPVTYEGNINILESSSIREEVNEVARQIIKDTRDKQYRYQDIAILYRDESYAYLFDSVLPQYDIPFNIDTKRSMTHHPIMEMVRSLLEVIQTNWNMSPMMRLIKTNILSNHFKDSAYLIDLLENFVVERGVYGKRWLDDKLFSVDNFTKMGRKEHKLTVEERETFEQVVNLKHDIIDKIVTFEKAMNEADNVRGLATAFYETMESFDLPKYLMTHRDQLDVEGHHEEAEEIDQIWNGLIQILDDLVTVFDNEDMTLKRFLEVFDIGLEQLEFVMIPQTLDQVSIGTMDLAKVDNKKHIYMVGMNDGAMPQPVSSSSLITDEEKKMFEQQTQVELSPTSDILQMDEAFVCYIAMTRGSDQVTFSYSLMGAKGEDKEKSPFLDQIQALFNGLEVTNIHYKHNAQPISLMEHPHQTKVALFESLKRWLEAEMVADIWVDAYQVMRDNDKLNGGLSYLLTALTYDNETVQLDEPLAASLYGSTINASVSRFEGYNDCPFKHYANHGLRLNERTKYKLENFDLGNIFHTALKYISDKINGDFKNLDNKKIRALTVEALENVLPQVQFNLMDSNAYYRYMSKRIGVIVESTLKALRYQNKNTKFKPQRFEAGFRKSPKNSEELIAQPLITEQGIPVNIRGQIDRIDAYTKNDTSYINIIDYKSSNPSATLDLKKVYYGKQMQMMTYMDIALQNAQRLGLSNEIKPGGLLYFHVHDERLNFKDWGELQDDALTEDKLEQAFLKEYKLRGLVNSDMDVVDALDIRLEDIGKSDIVPVSLKKDGSIGSRGSSVADETTIHKFIKHNKDNFINTATNIMKGHTEVAPLKFDDQLPCQFCNFKSVCHVDTMIDSKHYRHVDETIDPIKAVQDVELESGDNNE